MQSSFSKWESEARRDKGQIPYLWCPNWNTRGCFSGCACLEHSAGSRQTLDSLKDVRVWLYCQVAPHGQPGCLHSKNTYLTDFKKWILITCVTHNPFSQYCKEAREVIILGGSTSFSACCQHYKPNPVFTTNIPPLKSQTLQSSFLLTLTNSFQSHQTGKLVLTSAWQINSTPRTNLCLSWAINNLQEACIYAGAGRRETRNSVTRGQPLGRDSCTHL